MPPETATLLRHRSISGEATYVRIRDQNTTELTLHFQVGGPHLGEAIPQLGRQMLNHCNLNIGEFEIN